MHEPSVSSRELMAENETLRARMAYLLEQAERNHAIMCRHQAFDLQIVGASSFPDLVGTIFSTLPVISDLDIVTLSLIDQNADIYTVMHRLGVDFETLPSASMRSNLALTWRRNLRCDPSWAPMRRASTVPCSHSRRPTCAAWRWCL